MIYKKMPIYLDCNATTPIEPRVLDEVIKYMKDEYGNAGSRTHEYGTRAQKAVQLAREQVAKVVDSKKDEVIFTSGATESNNIAILGLCEYGLKKGHKHIISSHIEHKAVLEPLEHLKKKGFDITLLPCTPGGFVEAACIENALRDDTLLVSIMHVNNETGVIQPLDEICEVLLDHPAFFHTDAAQGFGKEMKMLKSNRIDLISISGHKIYAPKGVGALICRRRKYKRPPLSPLCFGGGQEKSLRPGTLPVQLIVGLGVASELAQKEWKKRAEKCSKFKNDLLETLASLNPTLHGDQSRTLPHVINLSFGNIDSEAIMIALKDVVAISNGSACTSNSYDPSHVLLAMGLSEDEAQTATRWSWCHKTDCKNLDILSHIQLLLE